MKDHNTIYSWFARQVRAAPDNPAIIDERRRLTYGQLSSLADTIAGQFSSAPRFVGIVMDHGAEMIASILAVLKSGAAYVPAEPDFPEERVRYMMEQCRVDFIITQEKYAYRLGGFPHLCITPGMDFAAGASSVRAKGAQDSLAYVLYTSGSTGAPKGVCVENRNVCSYINAYQNEFHPSHQDVMLQYSVCSFDIFVEEVFSALLSGGTLAIPGAETRDDLPALMRYIEAHNVTIVSGFPYLLLDMDRLGKVPGSVRLLIAGGDVLRASYVAGLLGQAEVYNTYGPSETTVCAAYFKCNGNEALPNGTYPVGKPILGYSIQLLDENMDFVQEGEIGEICIMGGGVSRGYLGGADDSAFVTKPDGSRLYRSGDLGYMLPDGNLAFVHRKDTQVMILGKRVEPYEVESELCNCANVKEGLVCPFTDEQGLSYLVAYVVPQGRFSVSEIKRQMSRYLAPFMIPEFFVLMDSLPMTANGKPDRSALPVVLKEGGL